MIQGTTRKARLTLDTILEYTTEYEIFRHYLRHDFKLGKPFKSPFFRDTNPSASIIRTGNGRLHLTVFGKSEYSGKCIDFVRHFYPGCNYDQILKHIDRDLNLGICDGRAMDRPKTIVPPFLVEDKKGLSLIQPTTRPFERRDFEFWGLFNINEAELKTPPVIYALQSVLIDKMLWPLDPDELAYGFYFGDGMWKIYRPFAPKRYKWRCNVPKDFLFGLDTLDPRKGAIQIKAVKDYKVACKYYSNCYVIQYEGASVINVKNLAFLKTLPWVLICNDPDEAGIKSTNNYLELSQNFDPFEIPPRYISLPRIKDLADVERYHGSEIVEEVITKNIDRL
jgi:hypothetical protein